MYLKIAISACLRVPHVSQNQFKLLLDEYRSFNAVAESFFNLLKRERIRRRTYKTREDARRHIFDYIEMFYKSKRKHARNDMLSPVDFENR